MPYGMEGGMSAELAGAIARELRNRGYRAKAVREDGEGGYIVDDIQQWNSRYQRWDWLGGITTPRGLRHRVGFFMAREVFRAIGEDASVLIDFR